MPGVNSPYYFVPLSDKVFYPDWAAKVEHDKPFRDGVSGELEVIVTAQRPIFTRNQAPKPELEHNKTCKPEDRVVPLRPHLQLSKGQQPCVPLTQADKDEFNNWISFARNSQGQFELPGALIHGAIRNIIKIAGFGSVRDADSTERYAVRDLNLREYQTSFVTPRYVFLSKGGWLEKVGEKWVIYRSDYHRVEQESLCQLSNDPASGSKHALTLLAFRVPPNPSDNSVAHKYDQWDQTKLGLTINHTSTGSTGRHQRPLVYMFADQVGCGAISGTLVFTGQPSVGQHSKHMEFIFEPLATAKSRTAVLQANEHDGPVDRFLFAHAESEGWAYWKPRFEAGLPVPVFYLTNDDGSFRDFGLAQMFRLPATKTLRQGVPEDHWANALDLADTIFGALHKGVELRGRAAFSAFAAQAAPQPLDLVWTISGEPRPTFYPNYLKQMALPGGGQMPNVNPNHQGRPKYRYSTLLSGDIRLSGWKRYAVWPDGPKPLIPGNHPEVKEENIKSATAFAPLPKGTTFKGKLRFHNLKVAELGALVWAIEWGGRADLRHNVGMAKGLSFGSVTMQITNRDNWQENTFGGKAVTVACAIAAFTALMEEVVPGWSASDQLKELCLLADPAACPNLNQLEYPRLVIGHGGYDAFRTAKTSGSVLQRYSQVSRNGGLGNARPAPRPDPSAPIPQPQPANPGNSPQCLADLGLGQILDGTITGLFNSLAFISFGFLGKKQDAGLHESQVPPDLVDDIQVGKRVRVKVIAVGQHVNVTMKGVDQSNLA